MYEVCSEAVHSVALWTRTSWFQRENGFAQRALIHSQKHENAKTPGLKINIYKARKREMTKTRKRENWKTRIKTQTRKPKTRKRKNKNAKTQKHENTRIEHKAQKRETTKTGKRENGKKCSRFLVFSFRILLARSRFLCWANRLSLKHFFLQLEWKVNYWDCACVWKSR